MAVLDMRNWLKMIGVHASTVPAKMIEFRAFGDWSIFLFIHPAVGLPILDAFAFRIKSERFDAIAIFVDVADPIPAIRFGVDHVGRAFIRHRQIIAC